MGIEKLVMTFPRGSDIAEPVSFETDGDPPIPMDMTGWTLEVFEAGPEGAVEAYVIANATFIWTNQAQGIAKFGLPWNSGAPSEFTIRLRATRTSDGYDRGLDEITVRYT